MLTNGLPSGIIRKERGMVSSDDNSNKNMKIIPEIGDAFKTREEGEYCIFIDPKRAIFYKVEKGRTTKSLRDVSEAQVSSYTPVLISNAKGIPIQVVEIFECVRLALGLKFFPFSGKPKSPPVLPTASISRPPTPTP